MEQSKTGLSGIDWAELKRQMDAQGASTNGWSGTTTVPAPDKGVCPDCGRCPTCGRRGRYTITYGYPGYFYEY